MEARQPAIRIEALVEEGLADLYRLALYMTGDPHEAEDLVQETFLAAQRKLDQLRDVTNAKAWLCAIFRNLRLKRLKRAQRIPIAISAVELDALPMPGEKVDPPPDEVEPERLAAALAQLPEEYREPLLLFYFKDLKYREIADIVGCPIGTVMSRLARGKALLRDLLSTAPVR